MSYVKVTLKNNSSSEVQLEVSESSSSTTSTSLSGGSSREFTLYDGSAIKVNGSSVHTVSSSDEGQEVAVA